jgi:hypothetical protein
MRKKRDNAQVIESTGNIFHDSELGTNMIQHPDSAGESPRAVLTIFSIPGGGTLRR